MRYNKGILTEVMVLMMNHCTNCGIEIEAEAVFCPSCGARQVRCASCGAPQREGNRYCSMCGAIILQQNDVPSADEVREEVREEVHIVPDEIAGDTQKIVLPPPAEMERAEFEEDDEPHRSWYQKNRRPLILGAIFVILVAILSSWFFSSQMREDEYQEKMTAVCTDLTAIHEDILRQMNMLDEKNRTQIASHLTKRLDDVRKMKEEQSKLRAPSSLAEENEKVNRLLVLEEQILSQMEVFCREPLSADPAAGSQMIIDWMREADSICRSLDLDAPFDKVPSLQRAASPLRTMLEKERKLEEERLKQIAMRKDFIEKMDGIVKDYESKKGALSAVLEEARSGAISSGTYRVHVAEARSERESLRSRVRSLEVPDEARALTAKLDEALTASLRYCDTMDELANPLISILQGRDVYGEARAIDGQVQSAYNAFLAEYDAYKKAGGEPKDKNTETKDKTNTDRQEKPVQ